MSTAPDLLVPAQVDNPSPVQPPERGLGAWLLKHRVQPVGPASDEAHTTPQPWWKVVLVYAAVSYAPKPGSTQRREIIRKNEPDRLTGPAFPSAAQPRAQRRQ